MGVRLEDKYTWAEIAEITAGKIEKSNPKKFNRKEFIKWFMEREKVGFCFDWQLIFHCYQIWKRINNEKDYFMVVTGAEGEGKSTISFQIAAWVCPNFSHQDVCFRADQFVDQLDDIAKEYERDKAKKNDRVIIIDEGGLDLFSREALNKSNKVLAKLFFVQRFLNVFVLINIPNFGMLDSVVRDHRVKSLLIKLPDGHYKCITGRGVEIVSGQLSKYKNPNAVPLGMSYWWTGYNTKEFPKTIDKQQYEAKKFSNIKSFINEVRKSTSEAKMVSLAKVAREIGCSRDTLVKKINNGEIQGKKIGQKWFLATESYKNIMNMGDVPQNRGIGDAV